MYKAVIFDLDGVICFTDEYHYLAWKSLADSLNIPFDKEINNRLRGVSRMDSLEIILENYPDKLSYAEKSELAEQKNELYKKYLEKMSPADLSDDTKQTLDKLRGMGLKLAVGSSCVFLEPEPEVDDTFMFDYSLLFIPALLDYFEQTGDMETLSELFCVCVRQLELARENFDKNGIVKDSDTLGWCFIDWNLSLNKQASAQGVYLYALKATAKIAETLGKTDLKSELLCEYSEKAAAANKFFWDEEQQFYTSGADKQISWASQIWLILGGAAGERAASLLERLPHCSNAVEPVTPYMYHHYVDALILNGKKDLAADVLRAYWGGMANSDTFGELYNPRNPNESPYGSTIVNSYCHAWSCGPAYFLRKYF